VKPASTIELNFGTPGVLLENLVKIGDQVKAGQALARIDDRDLLYRRNQAGGSLSAANASLQKILAGASAEDLNISQKSVDSAYTEYQNALASLAAAKQKTADDVVAYEKSLGKAREDYATAVQTLRDYTASEDQNLVNLKTSALSTMDKALADCDVALDESARIRQDSNGVNYLGFKSPQSLNNEKMTRDSATLAITDAQTSLSLAKISQNDLDIDNALDKTLTALDKSFANLSSMFDVLANSMTSGSFTETTVAAYKTNIITRETTISADTTATLAAKQGIVNGRLSRATKINAYTSAVTTAENNIQISEANYNSALAGKTSSLTTAENQARSAEANWQISKAQLDFKKAPARSVDVQNYRAQVASLAASYQMANKAWEEATIHAPIDGTISAVNYEKGEQTSAAKPAITMVSATGLEVEVDISESDIAKVTVGNKVEITLDAFGEEKKFTANVVSIDPAETTIQDVIYYQVKINFTAADEAGIKPGMTANITIHTAEKNNVLYVPRRAVLDKDGKKIVRLFVNNQPEEVEVATGLRADEGLIEILSGLNEGETIVTFVKQSS
jgi:HlyD family secretion protein